jgi:hypothetical protein
MSALITSKSGSDRRTEEDFPWTVDLGGAQMARSRPYRTLSIDDLAKKARASTEDPAVLAELAHELKHRTTHRARALAREVERLGHASRPPKKTGVNQAQTAQVTSTPPASGQRFDRGPKDDVRDESLGVETKYLALRETFTLEAEILSRWGLTSLAPSPLRDLTIDYWRQALAAGGGHPLGLTSADLERDMHALAMETVGTTS